MRRPAGLRPAAWWRRAAPGAARLALALGVLWAFQLAGGWLAALAHLTVPGSVVGLVLLAAALELRVVPPALVSPAAELLVRHLPLLYVPAGAALMLHWGLLRAEWWPILAGGVVGTVVVLLVTGVVYERIRRAA